MKRVHASGRFVDLTREGDRALEDRLQALFVLDASPGILVLNHQRGIGNVELEEFARGELMIEPVDSTVLQVSERIVLGRTGEFMLAEHGASSTR